ncbi:sigma factor-like helix-turn-helix DNA-binding protein [Microvirga sp. CF3062]|uniref:sigma factor-like helix-turn-helix DNA-binding protein n=1 Tax=Microvirga sp. CF3062 TaxID=3110182 RepID=UPI002E79B111|nr:sigma factor-like helix-turn-helix DNA-binding protein [Microvirga sp. CF3062]MEE1655103.1 sigma factor-like helix-turn-helix DNA-binding protein [Microvirga sp. CF3062]
MTTLKEFEDALREQGMHMALAILQKLRERDRTKRSVAPARRITGHKMTPELARRILELHGTTEMTQQEIAFQLGVNQGRVNEVIKRGKWLDDNPAAPEAVARDKAKARMAGPANRKRTDSREIRAAASPTKKSPARKTSNQAQLLFGDL